MKSKHWIPRSIHPFMEDLLGEFEKLVEIVRDHKISIQELKKENKELKTKLASIQGQLNVTRRNWKR